MKSFRLLLTFFLAISFSLTPVVLLAEEAKKSIKPKQLDLSELALPSEVKNIGKKSGSIFYNPSIKGKALMPVNFWGEIDISGLHFLPLNTTLIKGLSLAGGVTSNAKLEDVKLTRIVADEIVETHFDMSEGGDIEAYSYQLKPGDTIFVREDNFSQNRAYYTSLIGVAISILSSVLIYRAVKQD